MANYKTSWVQKLINGVWTKTFAFAHAKTVYTDYENKKTLDKSLEEVQKRVSANSYGEIAGGKNFYNCGLEFGGIDSNGDENTDSRVRSNGYIKVNSSTTYTASVKNKNIYLGIYLYDKEKKIILFFPWQKGDYTFKTTDITEYVRVTYRTDDDISVSDILEYQIEEGTTATSYEPYFPSNKMLMEEKADKSETTVNLLKPTLETTTQNGITITNNGDGTYKISGTATEQISYHIANSIVVPKKSVITGCKGGSAKTYNFGVYDGTKYFEVFDGENIEIPSKTYAYAYIVVYKGGTVPDNTIIKPMITTNLNATYDDFVPYTGDTGSLNGDVADLRGDVNSIEKEVSTQKINIHYGTGDGNDIVPVKGTAYIKTPPILVNNSANTFEDAQEGSGGGTIKTFDYTYALRGSVKFTILDTLITANTTVSGITVKPSTSDLQNGHYYRITGTATEDVTIPLYSVKNPSSDTLMFVSNITNKFSESTCYYLISDASGNTKQFGTEEEKTDTTTFRNHSGEVKVSLVVKSGAKVSLSANVRAGYSGAYTINDRSDKKYSDTADTVIDAIIEMKSK